MTQINAASAASTPAAPAPKGGRDWRIDFWRGLAIVFIFWNHSVDNVMSWATTKYFGLSDSAELFVFLSGFAIASMFLAKFLDRPVMAFPYSVGRAFTLYIHHITAFVVIATMASVYRGWAVSSVMERDLFIRPFFVATETVLPKLATLTYLPPLLDILPLYILLTLMIGLLFWAFRERWRFYVGFAAAVWLFAHFTGATLSSYPDTRLWTFNPFAWQAVFLAGFVTCIVRNEPWLQRIAASRATLGVSIVIVIVGFVAAAPWATLGLLEWRPLAFLSDLADKANASPIRLIHFLALAQIATWALKTENPFGQTFLGRSMVRIGRHSLPLFVISTVFAAMSHGVFDWFGKGFVVQVTYSLGMAGVLIALAYVAETLSRSTKPGSGKKAREKAAKANSESDAPAGAGSPEESAALPRAAVAALASR